MRTLQFLLIFSLISIVSDAQTRPSVSTDPSNIQTILNRHYRSHFSLKQRWALLKESGLGLFKPFTVIEEDQLVRANRMPELGKLDAIKMIRLSRQQGREQLQKAVNFPEERSWLFVPAINAWFYDSTDHADARNVGTNQILGTLLHQAFGRVEKYHTHPDAAVHAKYSDTGSFSGVDLSWYYIMIAVPSQADILGLFNYLDPKRQQSRSRATGYVVHRYGFTSYEAQVLYRKSDGRFEIAYPTIPGNDIKEYQRNKKVSDPLLEIEIALNQFMTESSAYTSELFPNIDPNNLPRIILRFTVE